MNWEPLLTEDGSWTLVHPEHGEACHAREGAWLEAQVRYALPCRLRERAQEAGRRVLRLLDVGTGLGTNLGAAAAALAGTGVLLEVLTLELDGGVITAAAELAADLPPEARTYLPPVRAALQRLLANAGPGRAPELAIDGPGGALHLTLVLGDACERLPIWKPEVRFDAVFLDLFSPRRAPGPWQAPFLGELARRMAPGALLSTFTVNRAVRAALEAAGLEVGAGPAFGNKRSGTLAQAPPRVSE